MASAIAPSPLSQFELDRLNRIAENKRRMEECGLLETAKSLMKSMKAATAISKPPIKRMPKERRRKTRHQPVRRSGRLNGSAAEFGPIDEDTCGGVTYDDYEPGLKDLLSGDAEIEALPEEKQVQFQEMRCAAAGRGSMYDSVAGITCHFCRQKKLCGEEGCPRCSKRSTTAECIGKSDCSRCHSATGRFCRACLLIRYGQTMEDVREEMAAGTWLCPHCYEEEHPEEGWMCNSSICMTRRGFKPTGIAIYDAQQRGFPSVAHWLKAQLLKNNAGAAAAAADKAPESSSGSNASSEGDAEVATAAAAAVTATAASKKVPAAAAAKSKRQKKGTASAGSGAGEEEAAGVIGSQESRQVDDAAVAAAAAAVAPGTPCKAEAPTPGPATAKGVAAAAAAGGEGAAARRSTRGAAAAGGGKAAGGSKAAAAAVGPVAAGPASKRACVGESAGTRKSLRFRH